MSFNGCTFIQEFSIPCPYVILCMILVIKSGAENMGGAEGAIAPPCFKVEGQCPPTFPYLTLLLSTNIIHLHLLQVIQLLEVGLLQSMYYHHYNSAIICTNLLESVTLV